MAASSISALQEYAMKKRLGLPSYSFGSSGDAHCPSFVCTVVFGREKAVGSGSTKKDAKNNAADILWRHIRQGQGTSLCSTEVILLFVSTG